MAIKASSLGGSSGAASNDFTLNLGTSGYTKSTLSTTFPAGSYVVTSANLDTSLDVYLLAEDGSIAGVTNAGATSFTITASKAFNAIVVYGGTNSEALSFVFKYVFNTSANSTTDFAAVGPRITAVTPSSVPNQNDTLSITGQNFATDVAITFTGSDNVARDAKSIVRGSSTSLTVTRPDTLPIDYNPYTITASNPGITSPTSSNAHKSINSVSAGAAPVWVTSSGNLSTPYKPGFSFSQSLSATDADGGSSVVYTIASGSLPSGLTLSSAGLISGTSSVTGNTTFSVRATDSGNNYVDRSFTLVQQAVPDAPTNVTLAKGGLGQLIVSFSAPAYVGSSSITGYRVTASGGGGTQTGSSSPITKSGLTGGTSYTFTVAATNSSGYGVESTASSSLGAPAQFSQTFTSSSTWTNPGVSSIEVLAVGGGGGGGNALPNNTSVQSGGGGAGGVAYISSLSISPNTNYSVTVGNGGGAAAVGNSSSFSNILAYGGGHGGGVNTNQVGFDASAGGSGGGAQGNAGYNFNAIAHNGGNSNKGSGAGATLLGNAGLGGSNGGPGYWSGGGGGAGTVTGAPNYGQPYGPVTYFGSSFAAGGAAGSPYGDYGIYPGGSGGYAGDTRLDSFRNPTRGSAGVNGTGSGGGGETGYNNVQSSTYTGRSGYSGGNGTVILRWTF